MENMVVYWDEKGNPLVKLSMGDCGISLEKVEERVSSEIIGLLSENGIEVDNTSYENEEEWSGEDD